MGKDGKNPELDAVNFLQSCTEERLLQSAMMADAAEENLSVVRFFDNPGGKDTGYDLTYVAQELHRYLNTLNYLFLQKDAGCLTCGGYTSHVLEEILKRPKVAVHGNQTFSIGGPGSVTPAMVDKCLARMACYVRLATQCVISEFPGWRCLLAFSVFNVSHETRTSTGFSGDFVQECWMRLGQTFRVPCKQLEEEAKRLTPMARHQFELAKGSITWAAAWAAAIRDFMGSTRQPLTCLPQVVSRLQAWDGVTSSIVEQGFSVITRILGHWRSSTSDSTKWTTTKVALDIRIESPLWPEIVRRAQKIWLETWGPVRRGGADSDRVRAFPNTEGKHVKKTEGKMTETTWRHDRAARVKTEVTSMMPKTRSEVLSDAITASAHEWNDSHHKAEAKLLKKQVEDKLVAMQGGEDLLPHEMSAQSLADAAEFHKNKRKLDAEHERKRRRKQDDLSRPPPCIDIHGMSIHCSCNLSVDVRKECLAYISEKGGVTVSAANLHQACMFVVSNPGRPDAEQCLVASLLGGAIVCPLYLLSGGEVGARAWYEQATQVPRHFYMSMSFMEAHEDIAGYIAAAIDAPSSKWKTLLTLAQYRDRCERDAARKKSRPMSIISLLTKEEAHREGLEGRKNVFDKDAFCKFCISLSTASSTCGTTTL